jgi:hypothetical protein
MYHPAFEAEHHNYPLHVDAWHSSSFSRRLAWAILPVLLAGFFWFFPAIHGG